MENGIQLNNTCRYSELAVRNTFNRPKYDGETRLETRHNFVGAVETQIDLFTAPEITQIGYQILLITPFQIKNNVRKSKR